jgi:hypothetical protein
MVRQGVERAALGVSITQRWRSLEVRAGERAFGIDVRLRKRGCLRYGQRQVIIFVSR